MVAPRALFTLTLIAAVNAVLAGEAANEPAWRLRSAASAYLRQQADQPIAWRPWDAEALEAARAENKIILVSIGYSTCHWCHVMAREAFSDTTVAATLNANVVCIKVDRDERPDLDRRFISFLETLNGSAGWPANIWLTPDGKPFFGTSYVPLHDEQGSPGFATLVSRMCGLWRDNPSAIFGQASEIAAALNTPPTSAPAASPAELQATWVGAVASSYDSVYGGFECGPKFPNPVLLRALLQSAQPENARAMALHTLRQMARSGMHDLLGGGFHRYAVDARWHCPHFEKMLGDQGLLLAAYADAFAVTGDAEFSATAESLVRGLAAFKLADGGLASALDAESTSAAGGRAEGAYYVWRANELSCIQDSNTRSRLLDLFGFTETGNAASASNLLPAQANLLDPPDDQSWQSLRSGAIGDALATLAQVRASRPPPWRDETELTASTALVVSGLVRAAALCDRPDWLATASQLGDRLRQLHGDATTGHLYRTTAPSRPPAFVDDYAFAIAAALDLHRATTEPVWLDWALRLQQTQDRLFLIPESHLYATEPSDSIAATRRVDLADRAEPSPNAVSLLNLLRLAGLTGVESHRAQAVALWRAAAPEVTALPAAHPSFVVASGWLERTPVSILVTGPEDAPGAREMLALANREIQWPATVLRVTPASFSALAKLIPDLPSLLPDGAADTAAYVCENRRCSAPMTSAAELAKRLSPEPRSP
ncbi:thioredoxin domain-containing protein [Nibricoccus sp. IMCC34717]|uniref:thioredoxin domain-containing protein n=1 Tax=Nibricoccus sp. IMCC34717 TaxID=3034021 RepID=UPI0038511B9E